MSSEWESEQIRQRVGHCRELDNLLGLMTSIPSGPVCVSTVICDCSISIIVRYRRRESDGCDVTSSGNSVESSLFPLPCPLGLSRV